MLVLRPLWDGVIQILQGGSGQENPILCGKHLKTLSQLTNVRVEGFSNEPKNKSSAVLSFFVISLRK